MNIEIGDEVLIVEKNLLGDDLWRPDFSGKVIAITSDFILVKRRFGKEWVPRNGLYMRVCLITRRN